jgi:hypothetical protein
MAMREKTMDPSHFPDQTLKFGGGMDLASKVTAEYPALASRALRYTATGRWDLVKCKNQMFGKDCLELSKPNAKE